MSSTLRDIHLAMLANLERQQAEADAQATLEPFALETPHLVLVMREVKAKPVQDAAQVTINLLEKGALKFAQVGCLWFPEGRVPSKTVPDAAFMRVVAWAELREEISEETAGLVLRLVQAAAASKDAGDAEARRVAGG